MIPFHWRLAIFEEIFPFQKMGSLSFSLLFLHSSAVILLKLRSGPSPSAAFWMNSCVHLCVCLCVRPINAHCPLPDACTTQHSVSLHVSPCIYLTVLLKCILTPSMSWGAGEGKMYSQTAAQHISLHVFFFTGITVIWALIYVLLWQRLTSFLTGSLHACTLGETTKAWVYRADKHHEG